MQDRHENSSKESTKMYSQDFHSSISYNTQEVEATLVPLARWVEKSNVAYVYMEAMIYYNIHLKDIILSETACHQKIILTQFYLHVHSNKPMRWDKPTIPALERWKRENQESEVILGYIAVQGQPVLHDIKKRRRRGWSNGREWKERRKEKGNTNC